MVNTSEWLKVWLVVAHDCLLVVNLGLRLDLVCDELDQFYRFGVHRWRYCLLLLHFEHRSVDTARIVRIWSPFGIASFVIRSLELRREVSVIRHKDLLLMRTTALGCCGDSRLVVWAPHNHIDIFLLYPNARTFIMSIVTRRQLTLLCERARV